VRRAPRSVMSIKCSGSGVTNVSSSGRRATTVLSNEDDACKFVPLIRSAAVNRLPGRKQGGSLLSPIAIGPGTLPDEEVDASSCGGIPLSLVVAWAERDDTFMAGEQRSGTLSNTGSGNSPVSFSSSSSSHLCT